jgi:uncharacterized protein YjlB
VCKPAEESYRKSVKTVPRVPQPRKDPVYGRDGNLLALWKKARRRSKKTR